VIATRHTRNCATTVQFLGSLLFGVSPLDPLTLIVLPLVLILTALMACYVPARRAAMADPKAALRYD
jgi:ABC-type lipoprotein release transport system permease subunit